MIRNPNRYQQSALKPNAGAGLTLITQTAYFSYVGLNKTRRVINTLAVKLHQGSAGSTISSAEIGLFSTPLGPTTAGQSVSKLISATLGDMTTAGPAFITTAAGGALGHALSTGVHTWIGVRVVSAVTMPAVSGTDLALPLGQFLATASSAAFSTAGPWTGAVAAFASPCLTCLYAWEL